MLNEGDLPPQIIKKIKKSHGGGHGGAWKVAYADFVTEMMALFIVLWVMSQSQKVQKLVANYFKNPIGFSNRSTSILNGDNSLLNSAEASIQQSKIQAHLNEIERLKEMGNKLLSELSHDAAFKNIVGQIKIDFVKEGLRIELVESSQNLFFNIGTAKLTPEAELLLKKIGDQLAKLPNKIIIEGHTDSRPYSNDGNGYTNFELSADRANSARRALTESSLPQSQIFEVRGYADRELRDKADPYNFVNRRISIIVMFSDYHGD